MLVWREEPCRTRSRWGQARVVPSPHEREKQDLEELAGGKVVIGEGIGDDGEEFWR